VRHTELPFSLYPRARKKGKPMIYVRFRGPDGEWLPGRSSGQTSRDAAKRWAMKEIMDSNVVVRENVKFSEYADGFFDWEGTYVKRARTRQRKSSRKLGLTNMGHTHADKMNAFLKNHLIPYFGDKRLSNFTSEDIEQWIDYMLETPRCELPACKKPDKKPSKDERPLSPRSINHMLICLRHVFGQAKRDGLVASNPCTDVGFTIEDSAERGVLTPEETLKLIESPANWPNSRDYLIAKVSALTGMRQMEVVALRRRHIIKDTKVEESWEMKYGLKEPKSRAGKRPLPIAPSLRSELLEFMKESPFKREDDFVFYSADRSKPYTNNRGILDSFYDALEAIEISETEREERHLVFHSLRHYANTYMRLAGIPDFLIQAYIGHSSTAMTDHYTHIRDEDFQPIIDAQERLLANRKAG
jgi:integrase